MTEQEQKYFEGRGKYDIDTPYLQDLLNGILRIYEVPPKYRTELAFIFAMRWARDTCRKDCAYAADAHGKQFAYTEKRLIEHLLISDIIEAYRTKDSRYEELYKLHAQYYDPDGMNIFNSVGVDWVE